MGRGSGHGKGSQKGGSGMMIPSAKAAEGSIKARRRTNRLMGRSLVFIWHLMTNHVFHESRRILRKKSSPGVNLLFTGSK
jgi:hypothetical protein